MIKIRDSLLSSFKEYASKCSAAKYFNAERTSELSKAVHREAVAFVDHVMSKLYADNAQTEQSLKDEIAQLRLVIDNLNLENDRLSQEWTDINSEFSRCLDTNAMLENRIDQLTEISYGR